MSAWCGVLVVSRWLQHKVTRDERKLKPEQFRRCSSRETLEEVISHTRYKLTPVRLEAFSSAVDHWLAKPTMNKLYDRVPASVWKYVTRILNPCYDDSGVICAPGDRKH